VHVAGVQEEAHLERIWEDRQTGTRARWKTSATQDGRTLRFDRFEDHSDITCALQSSKLPFPRPS
jgi:hypothetical protein